MAYTNILVDREGPVAVVTVNRPKSLNALNSQTGYNFETRVGSLGGTCVPTTVDPATKTPCPAGYFATGLEGKLAFIGKAPFAKTFYDPRRFQVALHVQF